jgi:4-hydroxythreonine-4-phosphate dehydrogenase
LIDLSAGPDEVAPGASGAAGGRLAFGALRLAADEIAREAPLGLLTAPVSKEWIARGVGIDFPGHTDYLAERFDSPVMMLMHGRRNSVVPLTIHIPLRDVPGTLRRVLDDPKTLDLLRRIHRIPEYSGGDGRRWALCGLNPHAGEGGHLGREEVDFMDAIAERWRKAGLPVDGPLPADAVFMGRSRDRYRLMLACYHDQGLAPFKALEGIEGVNCTIGLPFVRTSPDHGTGFDIAGRGLADPGSMRRALEVLTSGELLPVA